MLTKASPPRPSVPESNPGESFRGGGRVGESENVNTCSSAMALFNGYGGGRGGEDESLTVGKPYSDMLETPSLPPSDGDPNLYGSSGDAAQSSLMMQKAANGPKQDEKAGYQTSNNTAKYRSMMPPKLPIPSSNPYFTVPPGLSPATLLESPVLFSGGLADPSPTTGSFPFLPSHNEKEMSLDARNDKLMEKKSEQSDNFMFKPHPVMVKHEVDMISEGQSTPYHGRLQSELSITAAGISGPTSAMSRNLKSEPHYQSPSDPAPIEHCAKAPASHMPVIMSHPFSYREKPTADGYNWKKYGQKQLKGSEFPRSYYKCTYPNCTVKKQVECSHEGDITEIMYKGDHNHPKPQSTRRMSRSNVHTLEKNLEESNGETATAAGRLESDGMSGDVSTSSIVVSHTGMSGTPEQSFCSPSDEDTEANKIDEDDEDEQDSKRRKNEEAREMIASMPIRTIREPRVVVQTTSEVDILDDGYRWRKYGQKVVKGNLYPRSYYKCTNIGCIVRKHVERCSNDPKSVITTYEGKHNHNVPPARGEVIQEMNTSAPLMRAISGTDMYSGSRNVAMVGGGHSMEDEITAGNQSLNNDNDVSIMDYNRRMPGAGLQHPSLMMPGQSFSGIGSFGAGELPPSWELRLPQHFYQPNSSPFVADQPLSRP